MKQTQVLVLLSAISFIQPAHAYIGPGLGLGTIGTLIALLAAVILLIVGFVWYPLKRFLRHRRSADVKEKGDGS